MIHLDCPSSNSENLIEIFSDDIVNRDDPVRPHWLSDAFQSNSRSRFSFQLHFDSSQPAGFLWIVPIRDPILNEMVKWKNQWMQKRVQMSVVRIHKKRMKSIDLWCYLLEWTGVKQRICSLWFIIRAFPWDLVRLHRNMGTELFSTIIIFK